MRYDTRYKIQDTRCWIYVVGKIGNKDIRYEACDIRCKVQIVRYKTMRYVIRSRGIRDER